MVGSPAEAILSAARLHQVGLIVMCTRDMKGFSRVLFGSVAHHIAAHSAVPVLVLHAHGAFSATTAEARPLRVLVALDGSSLAEEALVPAAQVCTALSPTGTGTLQLARIVQLIPGNEVSEKNRVTWNSQSIAEARAYLTTIEQRVRGGDLVHFHLHVSSVVIADDEYANPARRIVETGEHRGATEGTSGFEGCDLIAMTTHGRSGLKRWFMGSVTEDVLKTSTLPLLVVHTGGTQDHEKQHQLIGEAGVIEG